MADTARTKSALQVLFADNKQELISPQDIRDFLVTTYEPQDDITMANGKYYATDEVRARDSGGLKLYDDGGTKGLHVQDTGLVVIHDGTEPTWGHSPAGLAVEGSVEFDAGVFFDSSAYHASLIKINSDQNFQIGSGGNAFLQWDTTETNDALKLGLSGSYNFFIVDRANIDANIASANSSHPTLWIGHGEASDDDLGKLFHDDTDFNIASMSGDIVLLPADVEKARIDTNGNFSCQGDSVRIVTTQTPASNGAGSAGEIAWDADFLYVCTATNTWERAALTGGY